MSNKPKIQNRAFVLMLLVLTMLSFGCNIASNLKRENRNVRVVNIDEYAVCAQIKGKTLLKLFASTDSVTNYYYQADKYKRPFFYFLIINYDNTNSCFVVTISCCNDNNQLMDGYIDFSNGVLKSTWLKYKYNGRLVFPIINVNDSMLRIVDSSLVKTANINIETTMMEFRVLYNNETMKIMQDVEYSTAEFTFRISNTGSVLSRSAKYYANKKERPGV
jgi:uncharacterized protein with NRDE domain